MGFATGSGAAYLAPVSMKEPVLGLLGEVCKSSDVHYSVQTFSELQTGAGK